MWDSERRAAGGVPDQSLSDRGPSDAFVRLNANVRVREEALVGRRIASGSSPKESMISAKPLPHVSTYQYSHFPLASGIPVEMSAKVSDYYYSLPPFYSVKLLQLLLICQIFHDLPIPGPPLHSPPEHHHKWRPLPRLETTM